MKMLALMLALMLAFEIEASDVRGGAEKVMKIELEISNRQMEASSKLSRMDDREEEVANSVVTRYQR